MTKKKYLIVGRGDKIGGGSEYIIYIINLLNDLFDVEVHMTYSNELVRSYYETRFINVIFQKVKIIRPILPFYDLISFIRLINLIRREKYDVVHTNTSKGGFLGRLAAKLCGVPIIIHTVHGFAFHEFSIRLIKSLYVILEKLAAYWCTCIITVNEFHRDWAIKLNIASQEKILAIPNGVDCKRILPSKSKVEMKKEYNLNEHDFCFLYIGRLAKQKGIEYLVNAAYFLDREKEDKNWKLIIIGEGPLKKRLISIIRSKHIEHRIMFLGFRRDVNNFLEMADVFILPSLREGLSVSILEAMAAQKPIITSNIGPNRAVLDDLKDAIMVPPCDPVSIKNAMRILINDNMMREKLSINAYKKFKEKYDICFMREKYIRLFRNICSLQFK